MKIVDRKEKSELFDKLPICKKFNCIKIDDTNKLRFQKENDNIVFVYAKGMKTRGYRYSLEYFLDNYHLLIDSNEEKDKKWHKRIARAIKCLEKSGLWTDKLIFFKNLYKMTLADKNALSEIYWSDSNRYNMSNNIQTKEYEPYIEKYPFVFIKADDGIFELNTNYIWESSNCKLKSMYFGKGQNAFVKKEIIEAVKNKRNYNFNTRVNYDVSFEYDANKNMAWYSEEYKDCGNGHYYLALDENTALFCEDD